MRIRILLGTALTAAVLTMAVTVVSGFVAADLVSMRDGAITRAVLVPVALAVTVAGWRVFLDPTDRFGTLALGLMGGWLLNTGSWTGHAFVGRAFTDSTAAVVVIDAGLWLVLAVVLVALFAVSPRLSRARPTLTPDERAAAADAAGSSGSR